MLKKEFYTSLKENIDHMAKKEIRLRYVSSPTGMLHVGDARTALFNWLYARKKKGTFVLRSEDMDLAPSERRRERIRLDGLRWLGIDWDEGPDVGGVLGPYRQSERLELYREYVKKLTEAGLAYPCYCIEEELKQQREEMLAKGVPPRYSGKCRNLTEAKRRRLEAEGRRPAIRFRVGKGAVHVDDLIHGVVAFDVDLIGDFVIVRSTGIPARTLAVVVDDALMRISLVIRGEDHLSNTPRQILVYEALGLKSPQFAHHAVLRGPDRAKLNQRRGALAVEQLRAQGFVPEAISNYLAWIGGGFGAGPEILSKSEMIEAFELVKTGKNAVVFDEAKLRWMNTAHLRRLPAEAVLDYWFELGVGRILRDRNRLLEVIPLVMDNVEELGQLEALLEIFTEKSVAFSMDAEQIIRAGHARKVLEALAGTLERAEAPLSKEDYESLMKQVEGASGCSGENLFMVVRAALTGETAGPELEKIFCNIDKKTLLHRIERALGLLVE